MPGTAGCVADLGLISDMATTTYQSARGGSLSNAVSAAPTDAQYRLH